MPKCSVIILFAVLALATITVAEPPDETYLQLQVHKLTGSQYRQILASGFEIVEQSGDTLSIVAPMSQLSLLEAHGITYTVIHPDLEAFYFSRSMGRSAGGFPSFMDIEYFLDSLTAAKPGIVSPKFSLGQTESFGADIWCIKISDNPAVDEDEPEVLYCSLIHAREPAGMATLLNVMHHLAANYGVDPEITALVNTRELYFVPCQNPDGYLWNETLNPYGGGMWRKNLRVNGDGSQGVDCNRNYGFEWGYDDLGSSPYPSSDTYRGAAPFSEPETQAIRDFVQSHHISIIHNLHSYANLVIWPWGYDYQYSDREDFYANLGDSLTQFNGYAEGISWTLYPTNGDADDWAWGDTLAKPRIISLTTEIGGSSDGFWPDPSRIPTLVSQNLYPNLYLAKIADNPYRIAPPTPPRMLPAEFSTQNLILRWSPTDSANPAVGFLLTELRDRRQVTDAAEDYLGYWSEREMRLTDARAFSGQKSWHERVHDGEPHWLVLNTPYHVQPNDSLTFHIWHDIQWGADYFYAEISVDGGLTYATLPGNLTTNYNPYGQNRGNGITGQSNAWLPAAYDLSPWTGQFATFRLMYLTDGYGHGEGVYIDDISPLDVYDVVDTVVTALADTSYTFASKTPGDYWYRVTATDAENQESRWSNLVLAAKVALQGDVDGSGKINVADVIYLVAALFRAGPQPISPEAGDINCSGGMNVQDITTLVGVLFRGQAMPPCD